MVKVCVPGYSILTHMIVSSCFPLEKHPHSSLRGCSHVSLQGYSSMSLEYPKLNTCTEANLGKFLIIILYEGLFLSPSLRWSLLFSFSMKVYMWDCSFLLYKGLFLLYEGLAMISEKNLLWSKIFPWYNTMLPIYLTPYI
jgi:hypothetical protein